MPSPPSNGAPWAPSLLSVVIIVGIVGTVTDLRTAHAEPAPTVAIREFQPAVSPAGEQVMIHGRGFEDGDQIFIGDLECADTRRTTHDGRTLLTRIPSGAVSGPLSVVRRGVRVASTRRRFEVVPALDVTSFAPVDGVAGSEVTLSGSGFEKRTRVVMSSWEQRLKAKPLPIVRRTERELVVRIPRGANDNYLIACTLSY